MSGLGLGCPRCHGDRILTTSVGSLVDARGDAPELDYRNTGTCGECGLHAPLAMFQLAAALAQVVAVIGACPADPAKEPTSFERWAGYAGRAFTRARELLMHPEALERARRVNEDHEHGNDAADCCGGKGDHDGEESERESGPQA